MRRFDSPRLTPLTAALLIPAVLAVVLAGIWLTSHAKGTPSVAVSTPTPSAAPTPVPMAYVWPQESGGISDPGRAYGRITLVRPPGPAPGRIEPTLAVDATVPPAQLAGKPDFVERILPPDPATVQAIAARLAPRSPGSTSGATTIWLNGRLQYDADRSAFSWQPLGNRGTLPLVPRDLSTAVRAAVQWLSGEGLTEAFVPAVGRQVSRGDSAAFATWRVSVPHGGGESGATQTTLVVSANGLVSRLDIVHPTVVARSAYPLGDWRDAWTHLQAGSAYSVDAGVGAGVPIPLRIDSVQVTSRVVQTDRGPAVIPMYAFADSGAGATAYLPALAATDYTLP
ncbi:MAG TPA: hypothetical protein VGQ42_05880 [Candidatus Dormibacteraeota bacterium]|jgi:hypothetical protein|nr:hypothetical protein [Candidatus Dormibacteraeota bacterium]